MDANEILIVDTIKATADPALISAAEQLHTPAGWMAQAGVVVIDRTRYAEAMAGVCGD
jgi:hypothetical protein